MVQGPKHFCLTQDPLYKVFAPEFPRGLVKSEVKLLVAQSCPTPYDPKDCSPPGSSVHRVLQARILEWIDSLLQGIFLTQRLNLGLLQCRQIPYCLSHQLTYFRGKLHRTAQSSMHSWPLTTAAA